MWKWTKFSYDIPDPTPEILAAKVMHLPILRDSPRKALASVHSGQGSLASVDRI